MINGVSPTGATSTAPVATTKGGGQMGKQEFLRLFVAQMKNQDPLNPMQGEELAAQLAQFSSVEQLVNLNQTMEAQAGSNAAVIQALQNGSAVNMLGRTVIAQGNGVMIPSDGSASVTVDIANGGGTGVLRLFDQSGREVGSRDLGTVSGGRRTIDLGTAAAGLPPGGYAYRVDVTGSEKQPVPVMTYSSGRVDGIRYGAEGPLLTAGDLRIPLGSVIEVLPGA